MDGTLTQVLASLYEAHREIDRLQVELAQRDQRIAEIEPLTVDCIPPGWRLVREAADAPPA